MKKLLTILSSVILSTMTITSVTQVISCQNNSFEPQHGWPPMNEKFLSIWEQFYTNSQEKIAQNQGIIIHKFEDYYYSQYLKYKDINKEHAGQDGYDAYGVPNEVMDNYLAQTVAKSIEMKNYAFYSLRLYFIECAISEIKQEKILLNQNEMLNLWGMVYWHSFPFYQWAKIILWDTGFIYETGINLNFYDFIGPDNDEQTGTIKWWEGPDYDNNFNPYINIDQLDPELWGFAWDIYNWAVTGEKTINIGEIKKDYSLEDLQKAVIEKGVLFHNKLTYQDLDISSQSDDGTSEIIKEENGKQYKFIYQNRKALLKLFINKQEWNLTLDFKYLKQKEEVSY
ncbi:hypothetical protein SSYRP_v1c07490 [Spiroplasma syrphidicola EA-1]|uniref:Uncharacterized protein n=1 Tax=Spiroplasma syrphidicola EA-1 TaxID=1276229 RepID=R4UEI3_9MOLU|nr:hypothetical protein [Spiroplasma syrphidicola]AGM26339.1 hypothetical protein SSYRP_v1c07490 [Spiroplasma syrphidicola EA-1]